MSRYQAFIYSSVDDDEEESSVGVVVESTRGGGDGGGDCLYSLSLSPWGNIDRYVLLFCSLISLDLAGGGNNDPPPWEKHLVDGDEFAEKSKGCLARRVCWVLILAGRSNLLDSNLCMT